MYILETRLEISFKESVVMDVLGRNYKKYDQKKKYEV
jgi:hypothetical protein